MTQILPANALVGDDSPPIRRGPCAEHRPVPAADEKPGRDYLAYKCKERGKHDYSVFTRRGWSCLWCRKRRPHTKGWGGRWEN